MTAYRVEGCLGVTVDTVSTINACTDVVQKHIPISAKGVANLARRLATGGVGTTVHVEYGGSGCTVYVEKD